MIPQQDPAMHPCEVMTLGILAGGTARRFGGRDKGMLAIEGETLLGHGVFRWSDQCGTTLINTHRNVGFYRHYAERLVCELRADSGPCAGIAALLAACSTQWLLVAPVDLREAPPELPAQLLAAGNYHPQGTYLTDNTGRHQLVMLLPAMASSQVNSLLDDGVQSVEALIKSLGLAALDTSVDLADIDTPDAL